MLDLDGLAKLRFGMSEVPKIGGQPGTYEENWGQWFWERSFFRDLKSVAQFIHLRRNTTVRRFQQDAAICMILLAGDH